MDNYELKSLKEKVKNAEKLYNSIENLGEILLVSRCCKPLPVHIKVERCTDIYFTSLVMNQELWDKFYTLLEEIQHYQCEVMRKM